MNKIKIVITENKTRYNSEDFLAWIEEIQWYVDKIESYAMEDYAEDDQAERSAESIIHLKLSNYASHDIANRFKQEWYHDSCVHDAPGVDCSHGHSELKLINPDRLTGGSAMTHLSASLRGEGKRADVELLLDVSMWVRRVRGWGQRQANPISPVWASSWSHEEGAKRAAMSGVIITKLHHAGLGVGIAGSVWDQAHAESIRHSVLQSLMPSVVNVCLQSTEASAHVVRRTCEEYIQTFQKIRNGHKLNHTTGDNIYETTLRNVLEEMLKQLNSIK